MSTILKALRRLEADERRKSEAQDLGAQPTESASPRRLLPGPLPWLFGALAVLIGAGIGVGLRGWWVEDTPVASRQVAESQIQLPPVEEAPASLPEERVMEVARVEEALRTNPESIPHVVSREPDKSVSTRKPAGVSPPGVSARGVQAQSPKPIAPDLPVAKAEPSAPAPPSKTRMASGPSRAVEALPIAAVPSAAAGVSQAKPPVARKVVTPDPVAARPETPPPVVPKPTPQPQPEVKLAARSEVAPVIPEKAVPPPAPKAALRPFPAEPTPPPVSAAAAATLPASLDVTIVSTTWHPKREKRSATLSSDGRPRGRSVAEGEDWMGWRVVEIKLSGVSFERQGVRVERKVGKAP